MIQHYLKIAIRNLLRYKAQTLISVIGLAVGFASFALSGMWVNYEQSYDTFHDGADRIYVASISSVFYSSGYSTITSPLLAPYLVKNFPGIESATYTNFTTEFNDEQSRHWKMISVDSAFISIFPVTVLEGNLQFLYNTADEVAISDKAARMLFGDESPIGKEYPFDKKMTITAVVQEWKGHSNYDFDVISRRKAPKYQEWGYADGTTLFRVAPGTNIDALQKKLESMEVDMRGTIRKYPVRITPLTEMHYTYPYYNTFVRIEYVRLFCLVSMLIVLGALSNYLIIYLIRIRMRQREWALRKVNGATEKSLIILLMSEIILLLFAAILVGLLLVEICLPTFKQWSYIFEESYFFYKETLIYMSIATGIVLLFAWGTLAVQRHFTLQSAISSVFTSRFSVFYRRMGLWLQLVISIGFIFCTVVMIKQLHHLRTSADMGVTHTDVEYVAYLQGISDDEKENWVRLMKEIPGIDFREVSNLPLPGSSNSMFTTIEWDDKQPGDEEIAISSFQVSKETFNLFGLQLVTGIFPDESSDRNDVLINEALAKKFGWKNPIGKKFSKSYVVAGVLRDIRLSPTVEAMPAVYTISMFPPRKEYAYTYHGKYEDAQKAINEHIKQNYPDFYMWSRSFSRIIDDATASERVLMKLLTVSSIICIIIAVFGVFSLVNLSCEQRRKEIAVRKVNGATISDIIGIFLREYMSILALAAIVAFATGYIVMKHWLEGYVIQTTITWWIYVAILATVIVIISISIGWRIWQAARQNPAKVIKSE
ncbi:ABC transporter permease [Bacteroides oleiciplenus]|uniref:ABC transporter permease n=1 Tax=Bacteroides oleiciplenus TaxID=626931 RepID=UPI0026DBD568|nr:ABC transporter permease [Bacteroides oleiciplenus]